MMAVTSSKAYEYCKSSIRKKTTPKYVKKQMRDWMRIAEGKMQSTLYLKKSTAD